MFYMNSASAHNGTASFCRLIFVCSLIASQLNEFLKKQIGVCVQCLKEKQTFDLHINNVSRMYLRDVHNWHHFSQNFKLALVELESSKLMGSRSTASLFVPNSYEGYCENATDLKIILKSVPRPKLVHIFRVQIEFEMALKPTPRFHVDVTMLLLIPLLDSSGFNVIFVC